MRANIAKFTETAKLISNILFFDPAFVLFDILKRPINFKLICLNVLICKLFLNTN